MAVRWLKENINRAKVLYDTELGELPKPYVYTDGGFYDIETSLTDNEICYGTWVGFQHFGTRRDATSRETLSSVVYDIVLPRMAKFLNINERDIIIQDKINTMDMYRLYVIIVKEV